ncbi:MAG: hypothetical protein HQM00_17380 [Magnetococcales bacterium]|nr:hypothetical protein [Magnetococcales bacterium]
MNKIFFKIGQDGPIQSCRPKSDRLSDEAFVSSDPFEIEAVYFRLCRIRTDHPGAVRIFPDNPEIVLPAYFRTDRDWSGPREQEPERFGKIWAMPEEGWVGPPARPLIQGVLDSAGITQAYAAQLLGIVPPSFRRWLNGNREMPWTAWFALLVRVGLIK